MTRGHETTLVVIGAGPRGAGVLERIAANASLVADDARLVIHFVDPHPPGAGRIWRADQSGLLKLNSTAEDVTMFTDASSVIDGPVVHGPSLVEWAAAIRGGEITDVDAASAGVEAELHGLVGGSFPTRRLQSIYLDWVFRRAVAGLPERIDVKVHEGVVESVDDIADEFSDDRQFVRLTDGREFEADIVLYALGHTGSEPEEEHRILVEFAKDHGSLYLPPDFTADADTSAILPGENVIVRGMGLASVDLTVLLTEGRGGRFEDVDGRLVYRPSGREPRLFLGSRRGVPYHSKISSTLVVPRAAPRFFTAAVAAELEALADRLDFRTEVWPLIAKEVLWGYYRELFLGHPERVRGSWEEFDERFASIDPADLDPGTAEFEALVTESVIDPLDRLILGALDRPLAGETFEDSASLQERLRRYIRDDLTQRSAPEHSATLALFYSLLFSMFDLGGIIASPKWTARSRIHDIPVWWLGYFSFIASGPPAHRLHELLALSEAGVVTFLGPDLVVTADHDGRFTAVSPAVAGETRARVLVDARLPRASVRHSDNPVLRSLAESGVGSEEFVDDGVTSGSTGKLEVRLSDSRILDPLGVAHPRRFAIGAYTNAPFVGAFARPNTNAVSFRENDRVARALLTLATELATSPALADEPAFAETS